MFRSILVFLTIISFIRVNSVQGSDLEIEIKSPVHKEILLPEITIQDIQNYFQTPNIKAIAIGLENEKKILEEYIMQINEIIKSINEEGKESNIYSTALSDYYMNPRGKDKNTSKEYRQVLYVMLSDLIKKKFFSKQEDRVQLQSIITYYSTQILMKKIQSIRLWNLNPPYERKIQDYKGDKLLLCGGRILFFDVKYKTDESYYTVDGNSLSFPDLVLNLTTENASNLLLQKTGGFDVILNEYCPTEVCLKVNKYAAKLLKSGGIFVSRICASDFEDAKKELLETGFSKIILANLRLTGRMNPIHDFKNFSKEEIIQTFMNISDKSSEAIKCKLGNKELNMIYFVAIK